MTYLTVMATLEKSEGSLLEAYRLNSSQIISIRDLGSYRVRVKEDSIETILSPICEIRLPGMTFYASGVADELLARIR